MTTLASLRILLGLDAGGVKSGGSGVRGELRGIQTEANRTQQTLSQIGKGAAAGLGIGAGLGAFQVASRAVGEFTSFLGDSVKAAAEEEVSIARLTSSLKANVPAWDGQTTAIEDVLQARMRLGFSDDQQRESLARLVAATHDVNEALALQRTAMDLAAFKSVDLLTASTALIKVDGGQFRALKELIGSTKDITTAEQALAAVHAATAGSAEALANTNSGKLAASGIAINEAMEKLGAVVLPLVADGLKVAAEGITNFAKTVGDAIGPLAAFGTELDRILKGLDDIGPHVPDATEILNFFTTPAQAAPAATSAVLTYTAAMDDAHAEYAAGTITLDEYMAKQDALEATLAANTAAQTAVAQSAQEAARAHLVGAEGADRWTTAQLEAAQAAANARAEYGKLDTTLRHFGGLSTNIDELTGSWNDDTDAINKAWLEAQKLRKELNDLPRLTTLEIEIRTKRIAEDAGSRNVSEKTGAARDEELGLDQGPANEQWRQDQIERERERQRLIQQGIDEAQRKRAQANADALRAAEKAAAEQAAAYHDKLSAAFDVVRRAAEKYFDALHTANLKAIKDAHDHANALLDAQKAANLAPVNEAQKAQEAIVQQRELAARQAALANATTPEDRLAATQALADFNAAARIAAMQANADTANAQIDVEKAKNDALAATATQAENDRATAQREAFANDLKALEDSLSKHPETWAKTQQAILKLLMGYGVDYKKAAQNLGDQFAAGLLASTRAAEEAGAALANAAGGKLGVIPKPIVLPAPVVPVPVIPAPVLPPPLTLAAPVIPVPVIPAPVIPPTVTLAAPIVPTPIIPTPLLPPASVLHPPVVPTPVVPAPDIPPPITLPAPIVPAIPAPSPIDHDAAAAALAAWTTAQDDALALLDSRIGEFGDVGKAQGAAYAEALLGARDAATAAGRAIASAALMALNVSPVLERTPQPVGAASATVADSLGEGIVIENHTHIYLNGEQITEDVERRMAARYSRVGSGIGG